MLMLFGLQSAVYAQTGTIRGSVRDDATDKPLQGATVIVDFSGQKANTNLYGDFIIGGVPVGEVSITIYYPKYKTRRVSGLRVVAGRTTVVNTHLKEELMKVNESVTSKRYQETEVAVITEIKNSENFATGVSAEQLIRTQDQDAAQSIKRLTGVIVNDERFVIIRGLNERYNQVMINDIPAPSMEVDSRAFSFDVVPTPLIDRLMVYKSGSADLPGDFAGGIVKIYTKDIPDTNRWYFGTAMGYRQQTTLRAAQRSIFDGNDMTGFGDASRRFTNDFPDRLPNLQIGGPGEMSFTNGRPNSFRPVGVWRTDEWRALPDFRFNLGYTGKFNVGGSLIGHLTMVDYQNNSLILDDVIRRRYRTKENGEVDTVSKVQDASFNSDIKLGAIHNWTWAINNRNKIEFKNLFNSLTRDNTTIRKEYQFNGYKTPLREWSAYNLQYERRMIYSGQLAGSHYASANTQVKWAAGYGLTFRDEPNTRRFRHYRQPYSVFRDSSDFYGRLSMTNPSQVGQPSWRDASQFYSELRESVITASAQLDQVLNPLADEEKQIKLMAGAFVESKNRTFNGRLFNYLPSTYRNRVNNPTYQPGYNLLQWPDPFVGPVINDSVSLVFTEMSGPMDKYEASNNLLAGFASVFVPITPKLSARAGVRYEANTQQVKIGDTSINNPVGSILPSLHLTYNFNDQALFRFAYNASVIRPALGELAPFRNYDFMFDAYRMGNLGLKTTNVQNIDARLELYPTRYDIITVGGFFKHFDNPIEMVMDTVQYLPTLSFINSRSATQFGMELEFRQSLKDLTNDAFFKCLAFTGNFTYTFSQVTIADAQADNLDNKRPLLGHSPYSLNLGIYYINEKAKAQANLTYNVTGPRVWAVGNKVHPTIYEMSRHIVSLNMSKEIGKHMEARLTIFDLLNMPFRLVQDNSRTGNPEYNRSIIANFRTGTYATVGVLFKL